MHDSKGAPGVDTFEALRYVWAEGSHSLCAQRPGGRFGVIGMFDDPEELLTVAARLGPEMNIWWGVHAMGPVTRGRGGSDDVVQVATLCADFDWADPSAHKGVALPSEAEVRAIVGRMTPRPTVVVDSGHGLQAYWGLAEPLDRVAGEELSEGFARFVESEFGLRNDRFDLASVLRLPGSVNNKAAPVPVEIVYVDPECGWHPEWLRSNAWIPAEIRRSEESGRLPPSVHAVSNGDGLRVADLGFQDSGPTPFEWLNSTFDSAAALTRLGWTTDVQRGNEVQYVRPGKNPRDGTSATLHLDTGALNVYSTSVDSLYQRVGLPGKGCVTLKPADLWMVENGITDRSVASSLIRRMMPGSDTRTLRVVDPQPEVEGSAEGSLNLPPEFWAARPLLSHIRTAAWSMVCSPDAVFAAVLARFSANLHPSIMLPKWGTLDIFVVLVSHSGGFKSTAGKTARMLWPGTRDAAVMMDYQIGSGEGLAESFFTWVDEEGNPCSHSKKGAQKVRTKWGLHFATDETVALTTSAARSGSIIIPTLCQAWMGEAIGQVLANPEKSRMIEPNAVRVSAELKIQSAHGYRLFADEYASTGLAQRMVCFSALDPAIFDRGVEVAAPDWPGPLELERPFILSGGQQREMLLDPEISAHLYAAAVAAHDPNWSGDPLDTHANLARLKIAALLALMDNRFDVSGEDWGLAGMVMETSRRVRSMLQATKRTADASARSAALSVAIEKEVGVDDARHKTTLRSAIATVQARIEAGKPLGKKYVSKAQRSVYEEAMQMLEAQGLVTEIEGGGWVAT